MTDEQRLLHVMTHVAYPLRLSSRPLGRSPGVAAVAPMMVSWPNNGGGVVPRAAPAIVPLPVAGAVVSLVVAAAVVLVAATVASLAHGIGPRGVDALGESGGPITADFKHSKRRHNERG